MGDNGAVSFSFHTLDPSDPETLVPTDVARSLWSSNQMHGVAISGALARAVERTNHRDDLRPARYTLDMFKPATMDPFRIETEVVREGARICLVDARLVQDGETRARASTIWLRPSENPDGEVWRPTDVPQPPDIDELAGPTIPWFASAAPWSQEFTDHQNAGRKQTWQHGVPVVAGEDPTPFTAVASIADATTMAVNWGSKGVQHINTDITLALSRLPRTPEVGLRGEHWSGDDGIAVGVATVYDREGVIGQSMVTALSNARRSVDFEDYEFTDDGSRQPRA